MHSISLIIAIITSPDPNIRAICGSLDTHASMGWGAYYAWCLSALQTSKSDLVGFSYGIYTFDHWSRELANTYGIQTRLYDCFATEDTVKPLLQYKVPYRRFPVCISHRKYTDIKTGRQYETLWDHLEGYHDLQVAVKLDVEGAEWDVIHNTPNYIFSKILFLDIEFHFCRVQSMPSHYQTADTTERDRIFDSVLSKLSTFFYITDRAPNNHTWIRDTAAQCNTPNTVTMLSVSYINKAAA